MKDFLTLTNRHNMKLLIILLFFVLSVSPLEYGHHVQTNTCDCEETFADTRTWTKGTRSGYYCMAMSRNGNIYKRYFSQWIKLKNR